MTENQFIQFMELMRLQVHVLEQILMELKHQQQPPAAMRSDLGNRIVAEAMGKPEPKVFKIPKEK